MAADDQVDEGADPPAPKPAAFSLLWDEELDRARAPQVVTPARPDEPTRLVGLIGDVAPVSSNPPPPPGAPAAEPTALQSIVTADPEPPAPTVRPDLPAPPRAATTSSPPPPPSSRSASGPSTASFERAGSAYLTHLVAAAIAAPAAVSDPSSGTIVGDLLVALARTGDHRAVAAALAPRHGGEATFEVRSYAAGSVVPSAVLEHDDAALAVLAAVERCADPDSAVEVISHDPIGLSRCVLTRAPAGSLRFRFPDITAYDRTEGNDLVLASAVEGWQAALGVIADVVTGGPAAGSVARGAAAPAGREAPRRAGPAGPPPAAGPSAQQIAEAVLLRLSNDRRAPRAHDIADVVAPLIPTSSDVAEQVLDQLAPLVGALGQAVRQANGPDADAASQRVIDAVDQVWARVGRVSDNVSSVQDNVAAVVAALSGIEHRLLDKTEVLAEVLREEAIGAARRQAAEIEAVHRQLRQLAALRTSVDRLSAEVSTLRRKGPAAAVEYDRDDALVINLSEQRRKDS